MVGLEHLNLCVDSAQMLIAQLQKSNFYIWTYRALMGIENLSPSIQSTKVSTLDNQFF